jgi:hypothetical protein
MRTTILIRKLEQTGSALLLTMVLTGIALVTVAGVLAYSGSTARLNYRSNQYQRALAAAEGDTEKIVSRMSQDYLNGGETLVSANLAAYRGTTLNSLDSTYWADWEFNDASGHVGQTYVQLCNSMAYMVLNSTYAGLYGYATTYTVVSNARQPGAPQNVYGGVLQQVQLAHIPIFQFAMYSSGDMEISCGQPFTITGRVHSNGQLYVEPDNLLTFQSNVTAVGSIIFGRNPLDSRGPPSGSVVYQGRTDSHVGALTLPIGVTNTPTGVREIIEPAPAAEDPNSPLGRLRYFNLADMMLIVTNFGTNTGVIATSGRFNGFATTIPTNELSLFVSTANSFLDSRESKTVEPIDINLAKFTAWSATNSDVRVALGSKDVSSLYVWDCRTLAATNLSAVRLSQGTVLPSRGLTVATSSPLYIWGNYNQYNSTNLGTADTSTTVPASLVADAITILSPNWSDANSRAAVSSRNATPTTVNAGILAGAVDTAGGVYGGGMENFPRFLETWGSANAFTYNGSMVKMFPSLYATNSWGHPNVYVPPARNWAFDLNFGNPNKLPPLTPGLLKVIRGQWAAVGPNQTTAPAN